MRFFARIVFICNGCFILAVILRYIEMAKKSNEQFSGVLKFQPLESTIVVLGYGAIIINLIFNLFVLLKLLFKKPVTVSKWIIWFNFLLLIIQLYYFLW